jgi:DNA-binding FadR family transcriptional regulator
MDGIDYVITKTNLYEQIADALEQAIMKPDSKMKKLPSEQELCKNFKVSRTVIREALKVLKDRGLIQSRNGEGSYISKPSADTISSAVNRLIRMENISNDDLHHMRLILETEGARLAAVNAKPETINYLAGILERMSDETLPLEKRIPLDADFHITIAKAGNNVLLGTFVDVMTLLLRDYMSRGFFGPVRIKNTLTQHMKILKAIQNRDANGAEKAMYDHLMAAREDIDKSENGNQLTKPNRRKAAAAFIRR